MVLEAEEDSEEVATIEVVELELLVGGEEVEVGLVDLQMAIDSGISINKFNDGK